MLISDLYYIKKIKFSKIQKPINIKLFFCDYSTFALNIYDQLNLILTLDYYTSITQ